MKSGVIDATSTPSNLPSTKKALLFKDEQAAEDEADRVTEHNRKVDLLITPKGHQRLRAFGYTVIECDPKGASTSDRRSL